MAKKEKVVRARAKCASFDIEVEARISGKTLVADELDNVRRKLKHKLTTTIAGLPYSHVYPYEVTVR